MVDCERANSLPFSPTWKVREVLKSGSLEEAGAGEEGGGGGVAQLGEATCSSTGMASAVAGFFSESNTLISTTTRHSP